MHATIRQIMAARAIHNIFKMTESTMSVTSEGIRLVCLWLFVKSVCQSVLLSVGVIMWAFISASLPVNLDISLCRSVCPPVIFLSATDCPFVCACQPLILSVSRVHTVFECYGQLGKTEVPIFQGWKVCNLSTMLYFILFPFFTHSPTNSVCY